MNWYRIRHTAAMMLTGSGRKRAAYLKKHQLFAHVGENCMVMFRKLPLYSKLISLQDNVWIASNVTLVTHDVIHEMLNRKNGEKKYTEHIGCIDIRENVFIGSDTTILPDVRIGPNVIVGAHSLVNRDLAPGGVYAGVPAKYLGSVEEYEQKLKAFPVQKGRHGLTEQTVEACWKRFRGKHGEETASAPNESENK